MHEWYATDFMLEAGRAVLRDELRDGISGATDAQVDMIAFNVYTAMTRARTGLRYAAVTRV